MKQSSKSLDILISAIRISYQVILPVAVASILLLVSDGSSRPLFLGSKFLDLLARLWLSVVFCMGYIIMSDLDKYRTWFYGGTKDIVRSTNDTPLFWNIVVSLLLGVFATVISWWAVITFLPIFNQIVVFLALLNGLLFFLPLFTQRKRFRV